MGKTLVIAEKPSVAKAIAKTMGGGKQGDGFIESDRYVFSWCFGHLIGLADCAAYDKKYEKWRIEDLPIIPEKWKYAVLKSSAGQYRVLKNLMARPDIDEVVNACDAGREGELIFRLVYSTARCRKPMKRLWMSSMEEAAIREGMTHLLPGEDFEDLFRAAECRHRADWAVGINATRLFTSKYGRLIRVGRVVAPTLAIVVNKQKEIDNFSPQEYWKVSMDLKGVKARTERIDDRDRAEQLAQFCRTGTAVVTDITVKERKVSPPKLFDLTGLQREANLLFGFTAAHTLELAQKLYENKLITYPRTDSTYLTDDMADTAARTTAMIGTVWPHLAGGGRDIGRLLNSDKVSDHYAILPTMQAARTDLSTLEEDERMVLELVASRVAAASADPRVCLDTKITAEARHGSESAPEQFTIRGSRTISAGWKAIEDAARAALKAAPVVEEKQNDEEDDTQDELPEFVQGETFRHPDTEVTTHHTKPPAQFTEASLLSAMEKAGASEVTEETERKGLGTPATRADVIERLVRDEMLVRKGKKLVPSEEAILTTSLLPAEITSPSMTADWENRLARISEGRESAEEFLSGIAQYVRQVVAENKAPADDGIRARLRRGSKEHKVIGICPRCGSDVAENKAGWGCVNRECRFMLFADSKFFKVKKKRFTERIARELVTKGRALVKGMYSERTGNKYDAYVVLDDSGVGSVKFGLEFPPTPAQKKSPGRRNP